MLLYFMYYVLATIVGGGYVNGTAESVATDGLAWTLAPLGIFLGLMIGMCMNIDGLKSSKIGYDELNVISMKSWRAAL